jgi:hypothetical protein
MTLKIFLKSEIKKIRKLLSKLMKTSLRDFYWRYDRGLEKVDTQKNTPSKVTLRKFDKKKEKFKNLTGYQIDSLTKEVW